MVIHGYIHISPTMHKFFIHESEQIESALLLIGQLTEDAQEAQNKDIENKTPGNVICFSSMYALEVTFKLASRSRYDKGT